MIHFISAQLLISTPSNIIQSSLKDCINYIQTVNTVVVYNTVVMFTWMGMAVLDNVTA